jgi:hypothetical protein
VLPIVNTFKEEQQKVSKPVAIHGFCLACMRLGHRGAKTIRDRAGLGSTMLQEAQRLSKQSYWNWEGRQSRQVMAEDGERRTIVQQELLAIMASR